jgi:CRP-like cAMP-binding protein
MQSNEKAKRAFDLKVFLTRGSGRRRMAPYGENAVIFTQGDPADAIYYIHKGKVKLTVLSRQGKEAVVAILGVGDFFGEGCLAGQPFRMGN